MSNITRVGDTRAAMFFVFYMLGVLAVWWNMVSSPELGFNTFLKIWYTLFAFSCEYCLGSVLVIALQELRKN